MTGDSQNLTPSEERFSAEVTTPVFGHVQDQKMSASVPAPEKSVFAQLILS
jgi:hypothetical protein